MSNDELNQAIQLVQQGQDEQAQAILEGLIAANQQDLTAWSWYVKSCRTPEKRLEALEVCLQFNPDNPQILEAIRKLQEKMSAQPKPPLELNRASGSFTSAPGASAYEVMDVPETSRPIQVSSEPVKFIGLDEVSGRPFAWYNVWWLALTKPHVDFYTALLQDPLANPGRAYWWAFLAALVTGLISLANPSLIRVLESFAETQEGTNVSTWLAVGLVVLIPIGAVFGVLGLILNAAISNLLAKAFGGTGNFARTVYLVGAFNAPISIISAILAIIPLINCLSIFAAIYGFRLHVAAIQAAQRLNGFRATLVVIIPALIVFLLSCIGGFILARVFSDMLPEFQRILENAR